MMSWLSSSGERDTLDTSTATDRRGAMLTILPAFVMLPVGGRRGARAPRPTGGRARRLGAVNGGIK